MLRSVSLWRTVLQRARADWPVLLAAWLLLVCATTLLSAALLYGDAVALSGLRHALTTATPVDASLEVDAAAAPSDVGRFDGLVQPLVTDALAPVGGEVALEVRADGFAPAGADPTDTSHLTSLSSFQDLARHAQLVDGRWPVAGRQPFEATLSAGAATALGLSVGSAVSLTDRLENGLTVRLVVTGIWRPDPADPYWRGDALDLTGVEASGASTTRGPFAVEQADLVGLPVTHKLDLRWAGVLDVGVLRPDDLGALQARLAGLAGAIAADLGPQAGFTTSSQLSVTLAGVAPTILVARSAILVLALEFAVVAGYAVLLVGGVLLERRRPEAALLRSRGASQRDLAVLTLAEAVLIAVPAAMVAPILGIGLVHLLGAVGPLEATGVVDAVTITAGGVIAAGAAAATCAAALVLPTLGEGFDVAGLRAALGRQAPTMLAQRAGLDIALVVLAVLGLWQLRVYGATLTRTVRGALGLDPLLIAAPAIGLVAGALIAIRLLPRLAELAERAFARGPSLVAGYGTRQLARRPLRFTRAALLLLLAVALGTFAAAYDATWTRSQADQAAYRAVADERVVLESHPDLPAWGIGSAYRAVPGVQTAMAVLDQELEVGSAVRAGTLLGIDPAAAAELVTFPPDPTADTPPTHLLGGLAAQRPAPTGLPLPDGTRRLGVTLAVDLHIGDATQAGGTPPVEGNVDLAVVVATPDGMARITGPTVGFLAASQRLEVPLAVTVDGVDARLAAGSRLEAVELTVSTADGDPLVGTIAVKALEVSPAGTGSSWQALPFDAQAGGWGWQLIRSGTISDLAASPGGPGQLAFGSPGASLRALLLDPRLGSAALRLWAPMPTPPALPALVDDAFLAQTGAGIGDTVLATSQGYSLHLKVIGRAADLPPADPGVAAAYVDGATLQGAAFSDLDSLGVPGEWWLAVDPAAAAAVETTLAGPPYPTASVTGRASLTEALTGDPISLGAIGALLLGSVIALAMAAIGFVVTATIAVEERRPELALLQAMGVSRRAMARWLLVENGALLAAGLLLGTAVGWLLAWLTLPFVAFTPDGSAPVPTPTTLLPWSALVPIYGVGLVALLVTALLVRGQLARIQISGLLRNGET